VTVREPHDAPVRRGNGATILASDAVPERRSSSARALRQRVFGAVLLALVFNTSSAFAEDTVHEAELRTAARDLALQGAEAFERRDYALALDRFSRAATIFKAPTLELMRARSLEKLGRYVEALDTYEATQRSELGPDASEAFRQAVADARLEGAALAARVPRLTLRIVAAGQLPPDLVVMLDGRTMPKALLDVERPVDPGPLEVVARAAGYEPAQRFITLAERERLVFELPLVEHGHADARNAATDPGVAEPSTDGGSSKRIAGLALVGTGGALLAVSTWAGLRALGEKSELDEVCHPGCPESMTDELDSFRSHRTLSYATLALGVLSAGAGGYLLWTTPTGSASAELGIGLGTVRVRGKF
jgi:hypothetical protein